MTLLVDECCAGDKCLLTTTSDVTIANTTTASASNSVTSNVFVIQTNT